MKLNIFIETTNDCSVQIQDTSEYKDLIADKNYLWKDCVTADIITTNYTTGGVINTIVTKHTDTNYGEPIKYSPSSDAWFTIEHIILPTKDLINTWATDPDEEYKLAPFNLIYCVNDKGNPYKYNKTNRKFELVDWEEISRVNPDAEEGCTISEYVLEFVSVCNLKNCYINLCQLIFQSRMLNGSCSGRSRVCKENNKSQEDLWYRRDLVWSALNVIKYMVEDNQFAAAELLIEQMLNSCNGVCKGIVQPGKDCGCNS